MKPFPALLCAAAALLLAPLIALPLADNAAAQTPPAVEKLNAYIGCINRLSSRSYNFRSRYFSWAAKSGPTGKERIIYGTYTIYDTSDCVKNVEKANALEPRDAEIEAAATAYAKAVAKLAPLLKEADDYYQQENYKDDKMAKGKALHPLLVAAWDGFAAADQKLRSGVDAINDRTALAKLAEIEQKEGRKTRYHVEALMIDAKRVLRAENADKPDLAEITRHCTPKRDARVKPAHDKGKRFRCLKIELVTTGAQKRRALALARAEIIHLAQRHALVPQDAIGGGGVEKEVREHEAEEIAFAGEFQRVGPGLEFDRLGLAAVDLRRLHALQEGDGLVDARLQVGEGFFLVGKARRRDAGKPRGAAFRGVARALHLAGERVHVGRQPRLDQRRAAGMRLALAQNGGEIFSPRTRTGIDAWYMESGMAAPCDDWTRRR